VNRERMSLLVVGSYLWVMMILFGSIVLETFMVYPNVFHDPPASFATALEFMKIRAPHDLFPPLGLCLAPRRSWQRGLRGLLAIGSC